MAMHEKVIAKIKLIARYRAAGWSDDRIMDVTKLSRGGLSRILALPEYKEEYANVEATLVGKMDASLAIRADVLDPYFEQGVPMALQAMVDVVTQQQDLRARMQAAKELLNRDPKRRYLEARAGDTANAPVGGLPDSIVKGLSEEGDKLSAAFEPQSKDAAVIGAGGAA